MITIAHVIAAVGKTMAGLTLANANSVLVALERYGAKVGLDRPHRSVQYLAQLGHESMGFVYDKEVWGPTAAQKRYDTRTDLGNTAAADGDGYLYRGRTAIQITGKANYRTFTAWARSIDPVAPDFVAKPDLANTDPWEGLGPIWYWSTRKSAGKSMNDYADAGNNEMITRIINGGLNGYADRLNWYTRFGLVLLGYGPKDVRLFQHDHGLVVDGIDGPATRGAIHGGLKVLAAVTPAEGTTSPLAGKATIRRGSKGELVAEWQRIVSVAADGDFGPKTEAATIAWQKARGLIGDGVVGPKTWRAAMAA